MRRIFFSLIINFLFLSIYLNSYALSPQSPLYFSGESFKLLIEKVLSHNYFLENGLENSLRESSSFRNIWNKIELETSAADQQLLKEIILEKFPSEEIALEKSYKNFINEDIRKSFMQLRNDPENRDLFAYYSDKTKNQHLKHLLDLKRHLQEPEQFPRPAPVLAFISHINPDIDTTVSTISAAYLFKQLKINKSKGIIPIIEGTREDLSPTIEFLLHSIGINPDNLIFSDEIYLIEGSSVSLDETIKLLDKSFSLSSDNIQNFRDKLFGIITVDHNNDMRNKDLSRYIKGIIDHHSLAKDIQARNIISPFFQDINQRLINPSTRNGAEKELLAIEEDFINKGYNYKGDPDQENLTEYNSGLFRNGETNYFFHWRLTGSCATLVSELYEKNKLLKTTANKLQFPPAVRFLLNTAIHLDTEWLSSDRYLTVFDGRQKDYLSRKLEQKTDKVTDLISAIKDKHLFIDFYEPTIEYAKKVILRDSKLIQIDINNQIARGLISSIDVTSINLFSPRIRKIFYAAIKEITDENHFIYTGVRIAAWPESSESRGEEELWTYSKVIYSPTLNEAIQRQIWNNKDKITEYSDTYADQTHINLIKFPKDKPQRKQLKDVILNAIWDEIAYNNHHGKILNYLESAA